MNKNDSKYQKYALVKEMLETPDIIRKFDMSKIKKLSDLASNKNRIFFSGEGSSRRFPVKNTIHNLRVAGSKYKVEEEGSTQAMLFDLKDACVIGVTNSGKTREIIRLFKHLKSKSHDCLISVTSNADTPIEEFANVSHVLSCGSEDAVAATKSVIEQGLTFEALFDILESKKMGDLNDLADKFEQTLSMPIEKEIVDSFAKSKTIYFAGKNDGVSEEIALKTNEITRKKSDFFEGTMVLHGPEEVMLEKEEMIILIDPFKEDEETIYNNFVKKIGIPVVAIADRDTMFKTIKVPTVENRYKGYIEMAACWNLLVEVGLTLGIDLDKPERARKIGNEFVG